jgi:hypothetical protein
MDICFARVLRVNNSPVITHATGPQLAANPAMKIHTNAIIAFNAALGESSRPLAAVAPTIPTMNCAIVITTEPQRSNRRRPSFSTMYNPGRVMTTLTIVVIIAARKASLKPEILKKLVP